LVASTGFDWLLIDAEHAPNDPRSVLAQLQAVAAYRTHPVVRPVTGSVELIKQYLDVGAQTLLVPNIESAAQAALVVAATRYPTRGNRGVGSALARASRWNQVDEYLTRCEEEICVLVQAESVAALENLQAIANVDGVNGVFFGPADLAASMGLLGKPSHPSVQAAIAEGIAIVNAAGKAAGTLTSDQSVAQKYLELGALFVAVGVDATLLVRAASGLLASFSSTPPEVAARKDSVY
jgi:4-hydroxy-2-oxoheptanedioate aldolase